MLNPTWSFVRWDKIGHYPLKGMKLSFDSEGTRTSLFQRLFLSTPLPFPRPSLLFQTMCYSNQVAVPDQTRYVLRRERTAADSWSTSRTSLFLCRIVCCTVTRCFKCQRFSPYTAHELISLRVYAVFVVSKLVQAIVVFVLA